MENEIAGWSITHTPLRTVSAFQEANGWVQIEVSFRRDIANGWESKTVRLTKDEFMALRNL